ncbi:unnamed protein product [Closterium sp. Naga37s-1]|nr:unnamed protein product [Closterium sp. Naga37s-1]
MDSLSTNPMCSCATGADGSGERYKQGHMAQHVQGAAFNWAHLMGKNFFHFTVELVPLFLVVAPLMPTLRTLPIILRKPQWLYYDKWAAPVLGIQRDTMRMLPIYFNDLIHVDVLYQPIYQDCDRPSPSLWQLLRRRHLLHPSGLPLFNPDWTYRQHHAPLSASEARAFPPDWVVVLASRPEGGARALVNKGDVEGELVRRFGRERVVVFDRSMPILQARSFFRRTRFLLGVRGAAHQHHMPEGAALLELRPRGCRITAVSDFPFFLLLSPASSGSPLSPLFPYPPSPPLGPSARLLFRRTRFLLGVHGAALTSTIFMPKGAALLEMRPRDCQITVFHPLAAACSIAYHLLLAQGNCSSPAVVDLPSVARVCSSCLITGSPQSSQHYPLRRGSSVRMSVTVLAPHCLTRAPLTAPPPSVPSTLPLSLPSPHPPLLSLSSAGWHGQGEADSSSGRRGKPHFISRLPSPLLPHFGTCRRQQQEQVFNSSWWQQWRRADAKTDTNMRSVKGGEEAACDERRGEGEGLHSVGEPFHPAPGCAVPVVRPRGAQLVLRLECTHHSQAARAGGLAERPPFSLLPHTGRGGGSTDVHGASRAAGRLSRAAIRCSTVLYRSATLHHRSAIRPSTSSYASITRPPASFPFPHLLVNFTLLFHSHPLMFLLTPALHAHLANRAVQLTAFLSPRTFHLPHRAAQLTEFLTRVEKLPAQVAALPVGDALWVAQPLTPPASSTAPPSTSSSSPPSFAPPSSSSAIPPSALPAASSSTALPGSLFCLEWVAERKRVDDLWQSIKSKRFKDQKLRIKHCGLRRPIYVVEGNLDASNGAESLRTASVQTLVHDGFDVHHTTCIAHTRRHYAHLTRAIADICNRLSTAPHHTSSSQMPHSPALHASSSSPTPRDFCVTFDQFLDDCRSSQALSVGDVFGHMLLQVRGLTVDMATAVLRRYPSLPALHAAYTFLEGNREAQERLLCGVNVKGKAVGAAISKRVHELLCTPI